MAADASRSRGTTALLALGLVLAACLAGASPAFASDSPVTFADGNLEEEVREALSIPASDPVTEADMLELTELDATYHEVGSITGLEYAANLTWLDLSGNDIVDVSPLRDLTGLTWLCIGDNRIVDISPLSNLKSVTWLCLGFNRVTDPCPLVEMLGPGAYVNLRYNYVDLTPGFAPMNALEALQNKGVVADYLPQNPARVARPDSYGTTEDVVLYVGPPGVLGNDSDADGDPLAAVKLTDPMHGTLTWYGDGSFAYKPHDNYHGADSFTYKASDGKGDSNPAIVQLAVAADNDAPVAKPDAFATMQGQTLNVGVPGVLWNDVDVDAFPLLEVSLVAPPAHGTVELAGNGSFTYTPASGFSGTDVFSYRAFDGLAYSNTVAASVKVIAVAPPPTPVLPKAYLTVPRAPSAAYRSRVFAAWGYLKPRHAPGGYPVKLQCYRYEKQRNGAYKWVLRKTVSAKAANYSGYTKYVGKVSLAYRGKWKIRAYHPADSRNAATYAGWRYVSVR